MTGWVARGRRVADGSDRGAFAILYAVLVVVLIGMTAMVVDIASAREDRRADRVLTDNAALAGADDLSLMTGIRPFKACTDALTYLNGQWGSPVSALAITGACAPYSTYDPLGQQSCPTSTVAFPPFVMGGHTVSLAWPVWDDSPYMTNPDIKPGSVTQSIDKAVDGDVTKDAYVPCERLAVQIAMQQTFSFATVFGATGVTISNASVALNRVKQGPPNRIAALNVLNTKTCDALYDSGQGSILVARTKLNGADAPGIIDVESSPNNCQNNDAATAVKGNGNGWICVDGPGTGALHTGVDAYGNPYSCNGAGKLQSHALDSNPTNDLASYPTVSAPNTALLAPVPTPEGGVHGFKPVTNLYGCATSMCSGPTSGTNYIQTLANDYGGSGAPTTVYNASGVPTFSQASPFLTLSDNTDLTQYPGGLGKFSCSNQKPFYVPPGNWYVNCPDQAPASDGFNPKALAAFGGGQIVFAGGIQIGTGGLLAFNVPLTSLVPPTLIPNPLGPGSTTSPTPTANAIVYVRGGVKNTGALAVSGTYSLWAPRTFIDLADTSNGYMNLGAGGSGSTLLLTAPYVAPCDDSDPVCVATQTSNFKRLVIWSECGTGSLNDGTKDPCTQNIGGQGSIYLLGVLFTPLSQFTFTGQAAYASGAAQIWADTISMQGQGVIRLQPDPENAVKEPSSLSGLIR